jgi:hypothetical protein
MLTVKRLYLYGVLLASLVLLTWGLTDLLRFGLAELARSAGTAPIYGGSFAREELSRALALGIVAGLIYAVHLVLLQRGLHGPAHEVADERASTARATYFLLVLIGSGAVLVWSLVDFVAGLLVVVVFGGRGVDLIGPAGAAVVAGAIWLLHLRARGGDLRSAPARTAGDWSTRAYLYGALFATVVMAAFASGDLLTVVARGVLDLRPAWESARWWEEAVSGAVAGLGVGVVGWGVHWSLAARLGRAPDPMGSAHRTALTRRGYLFATELVAAAVVLVFASMSLGNVFAELLGVWRSSEGARLIEDIGGPLLMSVPFAFVGWWHVRQASAEAVTLDGARAERAARRTGRQVLATVGLAGLAVGLTWQLHLVLQALGAADRAVLFASPGMGAADTNALALALVGLLLWTPAWARSQRDRARHALEAAVATSRRAYLMLASGVAVVAAMGSLAYLVWQATRMLLDSGTVDDLSLAVAVFGVSTVVLAYHAWQLRADLGVAHMAAVEEPMVETGATEARSRETIEISAPAGADFRVLNAAIRSELPAGYELRVVAPALPDQTRLLP